MSLTDVRSRRGRVGVVTEAGVGLDCMFVAGALVLATF